MKKIYSYCIRIVLLGISVCILLSLAQAAYGVQTFSPSNESLNASKVIAESFEAVNMMHERGISIARANESFQNALQIYYAQLALEQSGKKSNYKLVYVYASEVDQIKKNAIQAQDELRIFEETLNEIQKEVNLSEMESERKAIENSFADERFEETLKLINEAYQKLSDIESKQTTLKLFYKSTSSKITSFLKDNRISIIIICIVIIILCAIFWKTLTKIRVRTKINNLHVQKNALNSLVKKIQKEYFQDKIISSEEYHVKLDTFKEMIRDVERQLPLLQETIVKIDRSVKKF